MKSLTKIGVLSCAKISGVLYALIGLVGGIFFSLFSFMFPANTGSFLFGVGSIIFLPIFYGVFGFIGGAVFAFLYNLVAKWIGGIKIELK